MKNKVFIFLILILSLSIFSCKTERDGEEEKCPIKGDLQRIQFIRYHQWDGLRPNKIEFTFNLKPEIKSKIQIIDTTHTIQASDVDLSCWDIAINDSIREELYVLRQKEKQVSDSGKETEQVFYLDFDKMLGWSLTEMSNYIPEINKVELINRCGSECVSLIQDFSRINIRHQLDGETVSESDADKMNLKHKLPLELLHQ